jgi:hypothetical protein
MGADSYGNDPFGLYDVKLTNIGGTVVQVDLPAAQTLKFTERVKSGELMGDDAIKAVAAYTEAVEWSLEAGGISLEAYALITGRTATESGTTPTRTKTLTGRAGAHYPYFKIYGKVIGSGTDDVHCKIFKAKVTGNVEGTFKGGEFWVTSCSGIAVDDGTNRIYEFVENETATTLPAS